MKPGFGDPPAQRRGVCDQFRRSGQCSYGDRCKYLHQIQSASSFKGECRYFKEGSCRKGNRCDFSHAIAAPSSSTPSFPSLSSLSEPLGSEITYVLPCQFQGKEEIFKLRFSTLSYAQLQKKLGEKYRELYSQEPPPSRFLPKAPQGRMVLALLSTEDLEDLFIGFQNKFEGLVTVEVSSAKEKERENEREGNPGKGPLAGKDSWDGTFKSEYNMLSYLRKLKEKSAQELLESVTNFPAPIKSIVSSIQLGENVIGDLLDLFSSHNVLNSILQQKLNVVLDLFIDSQFFLNVRNFRTFLQRRVERLERNEDQLLEKLNIYAQFVEKLILRLPGSVANYPLDLFQRALEIANGAGLPRKQIKDLLETVERTQKKPEKNLEPLQVEDYQRVGIIPTEEEMGAGHISKPPKNHPKGAFQSPELYLNTHFHLLREDCIRPFRKTIAGLRAGAPEKELGVFIYPNIRVAGLIAQYPIQARVRITLQRVSAFVLKGKMLKFGNLVCLSADGFQTLHWATIIYREEKLLLKGHLDLLFHGNMPDFAQTYQMIESDAYFEAYSHVLESMKQIAPEAIPFKEYLVDCEKDVPPPAYLNPGTRFSMGSVFTSETRDVKAFPILDGWEELSSSLDDSQKEALRRILTKKLALVQGPPGTGKTFVGLAAMKILLANKKICSPNAPFLVITYTNHALDQFLEGILPFALQKGVPFALQKGVPLVRVGSRSKSKALEPYNLSNILKSTRVGEIRSRIEDLSNRIQGTVRTLSKRVVSLSWLTGALSPEQLKSFNDKTMHFQSKKKDAANDLLNLWLGPQEVEPQQPAPAERQMPNDGYQIDESAFDLQDLALEEDEREVPLEDLRLEKQVAFDPLEFETHRFSPEVERWAAFPDVWRVPMRLRRSLLNYWISAYHANQRAELDRLVEQYNRLIAEKDAIQEESRRELLSKAMVVGMTTTGAAKMNNILRALRPSVVIIEEAAEILEAHVLTSLSSSVEHLILIGDHQQLRPNTAVFELSTRYHLDVSLFERMINNGVDRTTLSTQRRMRPEISQLTKIIYSRLVDHPSVHGRPDVRGITTNLFLIDHQKPEAADAIHSKENIHEAEMIVNLVTYLLAQNYEPEQIVVLTFYAGQQLRLFRFLNHRNIKIRVSTVDDFQGEEADIILFSVVRSNQEGNIGYCAVANRICVAISRARLGFFLIGNVTTIRKSIQNGKGKVWEGILETLGPQRIGTALKLACSNHPETFTLVRSPKDFEAVRDGGCHLPCQTRLPCGHACPRRCHPTPHNFPCVRTCNKALPCGHSCPARCHDCQDGCRPCQVGIEKVIPRCGHKQLVPCSMNPNDFKCKMPCEKELACGHNCFKLCSDICVCNTPVEKILPCGHTARMLCPKDVRSVQCTEPCKDLLNCHHPCPGTCSSCSVAHGPCNSKCDRILVCGHACAQPCTKECPPCQERCTTFCVHSTCDLKCGEVCIPCQEACPWECPHLACTRKCHEPCDRPPCNEPCPAVLECGHGCLGLCGDPCPPLCRICDPNNEAFEIFFGSEDEPDARFLLLECDHVFEVSGFDTFMQPGENEGGKTSIQAKTCPRCKRPIRKIFRYANMIKDSLRDVDKVKKMVLDAQEAKGKIIWENMKNVEKKAGELLFNDNLTGRSKVQMTKIEQGAEISDLDYLTQLADKLHIAQLLNVLDKKKISRDDPKYGQLLSELEEYYYFTRKPSSAQTVAEWLKKARETLRELGGLMISEEERLEIVKAMGFSQGHWFKCPNGHIYAIGECGGAMQEGKCNECGEKIGGSSHRLLSSNEHAKEMDGSRLPAFTLAQDPANFRWEDFAD